MAKSTKNKRIERYLLNQGEWDTIWNVVKDDPMLVDHVFRYLEERIANWEYKTIPQAQLDKEQSE